MFTKKMLKRLMARIPRCCRCYIVVGNVAHEIKAVTVTHPLEGHINPARLWFIAGPVADHVPPAEVHSPQGWLNRSHRLRDGS